MNRPSNRELFGKIRSAKQAIKAGQIALLNELALAADAIELEYSIESELDAVLIELLDATTPVNYTGSRPPQRSYERNISGLDIFAFAVESKRFKCRIYYKFASAKGVFWLVSLHRDRPPKEE
jgi:hypothetical protein